MLSMLNPFYDYIANHIYDYFNQSNNKITAGDRFFLYLDRQDDVKAFVDAFSNLKFTQPFSYKHKLGDHSYNTISIKFQNQDVLLVIAYTSEEVHPDFLVTLRNEVGEQKGVWEGTALLSIVSSQLDSIQGGSSDLQKEGMPLHPKSLYHVIKEDIEINPHLDKVEKIILEDQIDQIIKEQNFQQINFFEFEDIIKVLKNGTIKDEDYQNFSLFKDNELATYTGTALKKRLEKNRELYELIRKNHEYGFDENQLEKLFTKAGVKKIKKEDWMFIPYQEIFKYYQRALEQNRKAKIELHNIYILKNSLLFWERPEKENTSGRRRRHIIIFNENYEDVEIIAEYIIEGGGIKSLSDDFIRIDKYCKKTTTVSVGKDKITIKIKPEPNQVTFSKVVYRHDKKSTLGTEFSIAVIPIDPILLEQLKTSYLIDTKEKMISFPYTGEKLIIGNHFERKNIKLIKNNQLIEYEDNQQLIIEPLPEAFDNMDQLQFQLKLRELEVYIPLKLINEVPESVPITPIGIWKYKRELKQDFLYINNRLILGNREFYITKEFKQFYNWELNWLETRSKCAELISGEFTPLNSDIEISDHLKESYDNFLDYFISNSNVPSLCYMSAELQKRASEYISAYIKEIESFQEGIPVGKKGRDLFRLGTLKTSNGLFFTPFHPLIVAYQLQLYRDVQEEVLQNSILTRLKPDALVPYLYFKNEVLRPYPHNGAIEWLEYRPVNQVSVSDTNKYLDKLVTDKIKQFFQHFSYLFNSKAAFKINVINIENDIEVLRGILIYMMEKIRIEGIESLIPIEVSIYRKTATGSAFDLFSRIQNVHEFQEQLNINLSTVSDYDETDVLRVIRNNLLYFKKIENNDFEYAHISFYKMGDMENYAVLPIEDMNSGLALNGLYSFVPTMKSSENYRSGFGIKPYLLNKSNILIDLAISLNELCANLRNEGHDAYIKNVSIESISTIADEEYLRRIYQASHWVTFIESNVDLEFFTNLEKDLIVIHYNDQYSSSNKYDAITVTHKTQQYYTVIREFLESKNIEVNNEKIVRVIQAFNTFNGEWLLRIIGDKGNFSKEKLSIVSAIKYALSYFDHKNIIWVPISLEEILRVAGAIGLNKSDGVFTAKNLGADGVHSDDLLMIGLELQNEELTLHFYPVEVKMGYISQNVINKAKIQVKQTKNLIMGAIQPQSPEKKFTSKFYRYFFVQLFLTNANKLNLSGFWPEKNYNISEEVVKKMLSDNFKLSSNLERYIGKGAVLVFDREGFHRSASLEDEIRIIRLPLQDGFNAIVNSMSEMHKWIQQQENDFIKEEMLSYQYNRNHKPLLTHHDFVQLEEQTDSLNQKQLVQQELKITKNINKIRVLIGKAENSNRNIYWEFGNPELPNRHLLISGKSGQGKTYFMQCLLLELSKLGISSIVIDYTEGFLPNQLEPEFKKYLGDKLIQKVVYRDKFPINPFKKNERDIGGITLPENNTDVAERIKSVFSAVYSTLGIQQLNVIYEATLNGLEKYGDNMSLQHLKEFLEMDSSNYAKTALSQIRPLIDRNPFSSTSTMDWSEILKEEGRVFIIQLTGFPRDVQLIITEFILWDLWNYSIRTGNKNKPIPVLLDEAQNLDHTEKSPSAKILTEGRKFGWSGWYATQFIKSQLNNDEIARLQNAAQKIFFAQPEQEIAYVASSLTSDPDNKRHIESKLALLKKGQCIVYGPNKMENSNKLSPPIPIVVNISPLSERIK